MKKPMFLILMALFALSFAHARSLDISIDETALNLNSMLEIEYDVQLDDVESFSYQIGLQGEETIVLVNETIEDNGISGSIQWNTSNYPAGTYEAFIFISPATYWPSRKFEILPEMAFEIEPKEFEMFIYKNSYTHTFTIKNTGNVPVFTALSLKGLKSESVLTPMTYEIAVNSSRAFMLSVEKPNEHYTSTLTIEASWENESNLLEFPVNVYNPVVVIEAENISLSETEELQEVTGIIYNKGNVYRNITLAFNLENETLTESIILQADEEHTFEKEFPPNETVKSVEIKYIGSDGGEKSITEKFKTGFEISGIKLDFSVLKNNWLYLAAALFLLLAVLYVISRKKAR